MEYDHMYVPLKTVPLSYLHLLIQIAKAMYVKQQALIGGPVDER